MILCAAVLGLVDLKWALAAIFIGLFLLLLLLGMWAAPLDLGGFTCALLLAVAGAAALTAGLLVLSHYSDTLEPEKRPAPSVSTTTSSTSAARTSLPG
jgi:hypothetical protein